MLPGLLVGQVSDTLSTRDTGNPNLSIRCPFRFLLPVDLPFFNSALVLCLVPWYICPMVARNELIEVERVQTGVRIEKRILKVLKAFAELRDITLGDLLEGIVLHAFEGKAPFGKESLARIEELKKIYGMTLRASDSHKLKEKSA